MSILSNKSPPRHLLDLSSQEQDAKTEHSHSQTGSSMSHSLILTGATNMDEVILGTLLSTIDEGDSDWADTLEGPCAFIEDSFVNKGGTQFFATEEDDNGFDWGEIEVEGPCAFIDDDFVDDWAGDADGSVVVPMPV